MGVAKEDFLFRLEKDYKKCETCSSMGQYDFNSLMHYPDIRGSKNRTIIKAKPGFCSNGNSCEMGQRRGLSPLDVEDIQKFYDCDLSYAQHENQCEAKVSSEMATLEDRRRNKFLSCIDDGQEAESKDTFMITSNCSGTENKEKRTITSPNYPNQYPSNTNCVWKLIAPTGQNIRLHFTSFVTEE